MDSRYIDLKLLYRESTQILALKTSFADEIREVKRERDSLEQQLEIEKTALTAEKKKTSALQEQVKERDRKLIQATSGAGESHTSTPRSSPTPSLSRLSMTGSLNESFSGSQWGVSCCGNGLLSVYVLIFVFCVCIAIIWLHLCLFLCVRHIYFFSFQMYCCFFFSFLTLYLLISLLLFLSFILSFFLIHLFVFSLSLSLVIESVSDEDYLHIKDCL